MFKYILLGVILFVGFNISVAVGTVTTLLILGYILFTNIPTFYSLKGNKEINEGNYEKALEFYQKAYKTKMASDSITLSYAILLLRCAKPQEAVNIFNSLIIYSSAKKNIKNQAKQYRTLAYYKLGQTDDALEEAQDIFDTYKNTISYSLLCYLKLATKQPIEEVLPLCIEAYEYNSDERDIVDNLTVAYIRKGEFEKAKALADEMLEKFPTFTEAYYHSAVIYNKLGNKEKAKELLDLINEKCKRSYLTTVSEEEIDELIEEVK